MREKLWLGGIGTLVLLGLGLRVYKAWTIQFAPDSDHGIVFLMAKHMAEGVDFPAFFYGQPYMGSLEPAVSALVCRLFGVSSFHVCLGTVLTGIALLPLIYLWGRDAGGRRAGLVGLLMSLVGSNTNFHFSVAPRGGYMAMMVCGVGTVYLACRIVTHLRAGLRVGTRSYVAMGLLAGAGWWSNQLVVAFLLAAMAVLLIGSSWRLVREGTLPALISFFAGSAPWWVWNATHQWGTFDFREALGRLPLAKGIPAFFATFLKAMDFPTPVNVRDKAILAIMGILVLLFLFRLLMDGVRKKDTDQFFFRLAAPLLCLSLAAVSVTSKYIEGGENNRYLMPLFPALMIMLGWSVDWIMKHRLAWLGWVLVAILVPAHLYSLPKLTADLQYGRRAQASVEPMVKAIQPLSGGICYGDYQFHWLNFASGERLCVATLPFERYAPYARRVELAEHPAFLNDYAGLHSFLTYSGGHCRETEVAGVHVDYDLMAPCNDWRYLDGSAVVVARDDKGADLRKTLTDSTMNTSWKVELRRDETAELIIELDKPHAVCGIRFVSMEGSPPGNLKIDILSGGNTNWYEVLPWTAPCGYFWSGSRIKLEGIQTFEELRFACPTGGVNRIRMKFALADSRPRTFSVDEVLLMEQGTAPGGVEPSVDECLTMLKQKNVRQFEGPRWMTERLACRDTGDLKISAPSYVTRSVQDVPLVDSSRAGKLYFEEIKGLLMDSRDVPRSRSVLQASRQQWEEIPLGSLTLMVVSKATDKDDWIQHSPVFWTEQGCFAEEPSRTLKRRSERVFQKAQLQKEERGAEILKGALGRVLSLYEWHQPARRELVALLRASGRQTDAVIQEAVLEKQIHPAVPAEAMFRGGIRFLGISLSSNEEAPGAPLDITYYWTCPPSVNPSLYGVFVNFQRGSERFQDDHVLLGSLLSEDIEYQPFPEIFSYKRRLVVPVAATPGEYSVVIGVVDRVHNTRLKPDTHLTVMKRGIQMPVSVRILQPGTGNSGHARLLPGSRGSRDERSDQVFTQ